MKKGNLPIWFQISFHGFLQDSVCPPPLPLRTKSSILNVPIPDGENKIKLRFYFLQKSENKNLI